LPKRGKMNTEFKAFLKEKFVVGLNQ
jgi:hypothetical protein